MLVTTCESQWASLAFPVSGHTLWLWPKSALLLGTPPESADAVLATAAGTSRAAKARTMNLRARSTGVSLREIEPAQFVWVWWAGPDLNRK